MIHHYHQHSYQHQHRKVNLHHHLRLFYFLVFFQILTTVFPQSNKTPALGFVWSTRMACRIALKKSEEDANIVGHDTST